MADWTNASSAISSVIQAGAALVGVYLLLRQQRTKMTPQSIEEQPKRKTDSKMPLSIPFCFAVAIMCLGYSFWQALTKQGPITRFDVLMIGLDVAMAVGMVLLILLMFFVVRTQNGLFRLADAVMSRALYEDEKILEKALEGAKLADREQLNQIITTLLDRDAKPRLPESEPPKAPAKRKTLE